MKTRKSAKVNKHLVKGAFILEGNVDKIVIMVVKAFVSGFLNNKDTKGKCKDVCSSLSIYLNKLGIECWLTEGFIKLNKNKYHHFWITCEDERIIDPTADQFSSEAGNQIKNIYLKYRPSKYIILKQKDEDVGPIKKNLL